MTTFLKLIKNPLGLIGLVLLVFFVVVGILAPVLAPPAWEHEP